MSNITRLEFGEYLQRDRVRGTHIVVGSPAKRKDGCLEEDGCPRVRKAERKLRAIQLCPFSSACALWSATEKHIWLNQILYSQTASLASRKDWPRNNFPFSSATSFSELGDSLKMKSETYFSFIRTLNNQIGSSDHSSWTVKIKSLTILKSTSYPRSNKCSILLNFWVCRVSVCVLWYTKEHILHRLLYWIFKNIKHVRSCLARSGCSMNTDSLLSTPTIS